MDGLLLCDKPAGKTSHDVVAMVRRALGQAGAGSPRPRVGHAGTLDPFATGLLIVLVGRATRIQRYVMELPKAYEAVARFGAVSTTLDPEGEITETGVIPEGGLALRTGRISQRPPQYSAVKVAGRRAYDYARAGEEVVIAEREVEIHRFDELWRDGARRGFAVECSSGTYIRTLVADLGDAYCEELRRTAIGPFRVESAGSPEQLDRLIGLGDALAAFMPQLALEGDAARAARHGRAIEGEAAGPIALVDADGPIAIADPAGAGLLKPVVGFRA